MEQVLFCFENCDFWRALFRLGALPTFSITDDTTANITDYPINYADPSSPVDGVQELRTLFSL